MGCSNCSRKPVEIKSSNLPKNSNSQKSFHNEISNYEKNEKSSAKTKKSEDIPKDSNNLIHANSSEFKKLQTLAEKDHIKVEVNISQNNRLVTDLYDLQENIGKGSFGSVFKVVHRSTNQIRAMKVIKKETVKFQDDDKKFLKEIEILRSANHPNIIKIFEYFMDDTNYFIIMEFISGGELYDIISQWKDFSEKKSAYIIKQILSAVNYLHSANIIHRDLKPENMLVDKISKNIINEEEINVKIIDFGTCNFLEKEGKLTLKVGSPYYIAPEVLKRNYNNKCDIWSCGVILYVLLVGYPPFTGETPEELFENIKKGEFSMDETSWKSISSNAKSLVKKLLEYDSSLRYTAQEALDHPWINQKNHEEENVNSSSMKELINNIRIFNAGEKFQQATISYIVHFLYPSEEIQDFIKVFKSIDINNDGKLSYQELYNGLEKAFGKDIKNIEMKKFIKEIDCNSDGVISYQEFLSAAINKNKLLNEQNLKHAFEFFDTDNDKKLSVEEIKKVLGTSKQNYVSQLMDVIDHDKNNTIDFEEFKVLMNSMLTNNNLDCYKLKSKGEIESVNKLDGSQNDKETVV